MRIHLDEDASVPTRRAIAADLAAIEKLIDRCERELANTDLNVKLTDFVRLLEFKSKLQPAVEAEKTFWSMIDDMRREELQRWSDPGSGNDNKGSKSRKEPRDLE